MIIGRFCPAQHKMKKDRILTAVPPLPKRSRDQKTLRALSAEQTDMLFKSVGQKLREGLSDEAEKILVRNIEDFAHKPRDLANLKQLLSFTLETAGRYKESLETIREFDGENALADLDAETQIKITTQLAIAYNNTGDQPKAVTLLKENRDRANGEELRYLAGGIDIALARVYRKLSEYPICRDYAQKALEHARENG